jgi:hypothetical protein
LINLWNVTSSNIFVEKRYRVGFIVLWQAQIWIGM